MQPARTFALAASGLVVTRGDRTVLRSVSITADAGEVVGVLGPSGAGKSTLFQAIVGEITVDSGLILLAGEDVTKAPLWARARRGIGYVPQTPSVLWDLTVMQNLQVFHEVVHGARDSGDHVRALAAKVSLEGRRDVRAGALSGGERRRLELARALTRTPKVLVCDEPFAGVDPAQASHLGDLLRELAASEKVTVLLADHHVAEALRVCTRALLLLDGAIAVDKSPAEFELDDLVRGRYLGTLTT